MKLTNIMNRVMLGMQYVPLVAAAMQQVELTGLPGVTKKAIILSSIHAATDIGEQLPDSHIQIISSLVDLLAGILFPTHIADTVKAK